MNQRLYPLIPLLFVSLLTIAVSGVSAAPITGVDRILALVNDDIILKSELEQEVSMVAQRLRGQRASLPPADVLAQQVLEKMITERLQQQAAKQAGIVIDEITTDRALQRIAKRNKLTLSAFREALGQQGVRYLDFRENLKKEIALEKLKVKKVENKVTISSSEAEQLSRQLAADSADEMRQYLLGHILVPLPEGASPEQIQQAKAKVGTISEQLRNGADFRQTAMRSSAGSEALEGGLLEWRTRAE
ncbi:MAG: molecular chaperone SurA, partial [Gammaproteobacteria bacterium]|nr:molecular chaperone SurA [Gammaproteobacteria bacterium]